MILGKIVGRLSTTNFEFLVEGDAKKFQYIQVYHKDYDYVLCQIVELEKDAEKTIAKCNVIGYREDNRIKQVRTPFEPGTEVLRADDGFIRLVLELETKESAYIGMLEGRDIPIYLDLNKLLSKHIAIIAKSGSGKSYAAAVLIEEIIEKRIPLLVIDPHGEYSHLKIPSQDKEELEKFNIMPASYIESLQLYGSIAINQDLKPLLLNPPNDAEELVHLLPARLSSSQSALLYSVMSELRSTDLDSILLELHRSNNAAKFNVINAVNHLKNLGIFSQNFTSYNELVQPGKATIIDLKGIEPETQQIIVYKLFKGLFDERKNNKIPPFFAVIEEAHNYIPERGYGESSKSSKILRTISSEGRKFGLGLCFITQRPSRIEKNALSQCTTQIILKVTNPNDLRAISSSVEGITPETENEIVNLPVGTAMITGIVDMPLFVNVRPRKTKHGGEAVNMINDSEANVVEETRKFEENALLPIIKPKITKEEIKLSSEREIKSITTYLIPAVLFSCVKEGNEFNLLMDLVKGEIITSISQSESFPLPKPENFSVNELNVIKVALSLNEFGESDLISSSLLGQATTQNLFNSLLRKDIFQFKKNKYCINKSFKLLFEPEELACYEKIEFINVQFDKQIDKKILPDELKSILSKFVTIISSKEAFIVYHKAEYL